MAELNSILLIDDDDATNFYHQTIIESANCTKHIKVCSSASKALEYLTNTHIEGYLLPDLIFLDINMPSMNGWEFLDEYEKLHTDLKAKIMIVMLTASVNPSDNERAQQHKHVSGFVEKPLTREILKEVISKIG